MIVWNKVTWYSKLLAVIFFIGVLPAWTFYVGTQYQNAKSVYENSDALQPQVDYGNPTTKPQSAAALTIGQLTNITIPDFLDASGTPVTLKEGNYESHDADGGLFLSETLSQGSTTYAVGELNGDTANDIAAVVGVSGGGSGYFSYLSIFLNNNGLPKYVTSELLGDRVDIKNMTIENSVITIDLITQGPGEPMCCGTTPETVRYKLGSDNSLIAL